MSARVPSSLFVTIVLSLGLVVSAVPRAARAASASGHLSIGYSKLFVTNAPGGSLSIGGGVDIPAFENVRAGLDLGFHLLGSRTVVRGSLFTNVDYSLFEAVAFAHWTPENLGPIGRVSIGPGLMNARADLSSSGGGVAFSDLAVSDFAPGVALDVTLIKRAPALVKVGFVAGVRFAFLSDDTWKIATARLTFHY